MQANATDAEWDAYTNSFQPYLRRRDTAYKPRESKKCPCGRPFNKCKIHTDPCDCKKCQAIRSPWTKIGPAYEAGLKRKLWPKPTDSFYQLCFAYGRCPECNKKYYSPSSQRCDCHTRYKTAEDYY